MTVLSIIAIYIAGIFVARWLNKIAYQADDEYEKSPLSWFFSWVVVIIFTLSLFWYEILKKDNWFTGKNWKRRSK